jgi:hypothetical protein
MKKTFLAITILLSFNAFSQSVSGYWYGNANVTAKNATNNYLIELILKQEKTQVKGIINYYFRQTFRSLKVNGNYNSMTRQLTLFNIPLTYHGSGDNMEVDCMMDMMAILRVAVAGSNLTGNFQGKADYKYTCGNINFDLKYKADISKEDSILHAIKLYKEQYQVWKPTVEDTLVSANIIPRKVVNYVVEEQFKKRENVVANEITVNSDSLKVDFYDNGEIDGDSISIFYNNNLIAFNRLLSTRAVHFNIGLDTTREVNEITMFADNLGSIPPNTALMVVTDGKKQYQIRMASSLEQNATLRIRRNKQKINRNL